jgi:hypothetical protein
MAKDLPFVIARRVAPWRSPLPDSRRGTVSAER